MSSTLAHALEAAAKIAPTRGYTFLTDAGVPSFAPDANASFVSYPALEEATRRFGGAMQGAGLRKGDRVALILPDNEQFVLCFLGAIRAGIIPVPIYPPVGLGALQGYLDNTRHIVARSGAKVLVTAANIRRLLGTVQASCPDLQKVVTVEEMGVGSHPFREETIAPDDVAFLQFTSGSTSRPKGVTLTHQNLIANVKCIMVDGLASNDVDVGVSWLPLFHDMGLIGFVLAPLVHDVPVTFLPSLLFLKRPVTWFQAMTRYKGSIAFAPNFAYALSIKRIKEADLAGIDLSSWRIAGCGAEPIRPETLEGFAEAFGKCGFSKGALLPSYGMAESSLAISFTPRHQGMKTVSVDGQKLWSDGVAEDAQDDAESAVRLVSCGSAFPAHDIGIFALDDVQSSSPLPEGHVGEIRIQGPSVMRGYWEDDEKTRETFAGTFLRTGDLGFLKDGRLFICGRSKEVIILHGRNYYPQDIEWEASRAQGVRKGNVIAFGARDPKMPDRERVVVAFEVQTKELLEQAKEIGQQVRKMVQEGMSVTLDDAVALAPGVLPKTSSGKLQRARTRELYEAGELEERKGARDQNRIELVKEAAKSQLSYFKLAVLGSRKPNK